MLPAAFSVTFDHEQTRPQVPSIFIMARASEMNSSVYEDTWIDPITKTGMLRPPNLYGEFYTSNSGIYAKPAKAAYEFATSGNWEEAEWFVGAGKFLRTQTAAEWARTGTAPGKNRGVIVTFVNYGAGDQGTICYFGWDDTDISSSSTLYFEMAAGGRLDCYKNGSYVQSLNINIPQANEMVELLLLPMRTREMLVFCQNTGSGGVIVFDDIAEGASSPTISPAEKFWWKPQSSATVAQVQIVPCSFETTGYMTSDLITFSRPPRTGATLRTTSNPVFTSVTNANVYGVKAGAGTTDIPSIAVYEDDGTTSYTPDGTITQVRVRVNFSGDGSYTPFFYGLFNDYPGTTDVTDDTDEYVADDYLTALSLDIPDSAFEAKMTTELKEPDTLASSILKLRTVRNRPAKLEVGSLVLWDGWTMPTRFTDSLTDEGKRALVDVRDMTRVLDLVMFRDEVPFDGFELSLPATGSNYSMLEFVLEYAGFARSQMNLSDAEYILPEVPGITSGEWGFSIRPGDTVRSVLEQVHDEFAADWFMGPRPSASGPQFCFLKPSDLPSTAAISVYRSQADAITDGVSSSEAWKYVMTTYEDAPEEVDANLIFATGIDPRTDGVVQSYAEDSASIDCTTAAGSRPDNWIGVERPFGVFDPRLRTTDDTDKAVELLAEVVGASRLVGQFTTPTMLWYNSDPGGTDVMLPVWRGDLVTIYGVGDVRITSVHVDSLRNESGGTIVTRARYTFGGFTHSGGSSLATIQEKNNARRARSQIDLRRTDFLNPAVRKIKRSVV